MIKTTKLWLTQHRLNSKSPQKRLEAIRQLREDKDPDVVELLANALSDSEIPIRVEAAGALGDLKDAAAVQSLIQTLRDPAEEVQEAVVQALQRIQDPAAVDALAGAMLHSPPGVQWRAARALQSMGWVPRRQDEEIQFLVSTGKWKRVVMFGPAAIPVIASVFRGGSYEQRVAAIEALGEIGDASSFKPLLGALKDEEALVRSAAINALSRGGNMEAVPGIIALLQDRDRNVRAAAATALGELGDRQAVGPLTELLGDVDWEVRVGTLQSLGKLGDAQAVAAITPLLKDKDQEVRAQAAEALGRLGDTRDAGVVDMLVLAMIDEHVGVRQAAARSLTMIEPYWERTEQVQALVTEIQAALKHRDAGVQYAATSLLRRITGRSLPEASPTVSTGQTEFLRQAGPMAGILQELLRDRDEGVRLAAAESLGRLRQPATAGALRGALNDSSQWVRQAAQAALAELGN